MADGLQIRRIEELDLYFSGDMAAAMGQRSQGGYQRVRDALLFLGGTGGGHRKPELPGERECNGARDSRRVIRRLRAIGWRHTSVLEMCYSPLVLPKNYDRFGVAKGMVANLARSVRDVREALCERRDAHKRGSDGFKALQARVREFDAEVVLRARRMAYDAHEAYRTQRAPRKRRERAIVTPDERSARREAQAERAHAG